MDFVCDEGLCFIIVCCRRLNRSDTPGLMVLSGLGMWKERGERKWRVRKREQKPEHF